MSAIDITALSESAIRYQKDLQTLVYAVMAERLGLMGISIVPGIQNKDVLTTFLRKAGIAKPYIGDGTVENSDVGKAIEIILEVQKAYASVKDTIQAYKKTIVGPDVLLGKNKSKKHPWQKLMLSSIVKTFAEDVLFVALFHGERDTGDQTPNGLFDGFHKKLDDWVVGGEISVANGNYNTAIGAISAPTDEADSDAANQILAFWRSSTPLLRQQKETILLMHPDLADIYDDAYFNKFRYKPNQDNFGRTILHGTGNKCKISRSNEIGDGQRMILSIPGTMELGLDTFSDQQFVQVRDIYEDPNFVNFWLQADYGVRFRAYDKKMLYINNQSVGNVENLSGDYIS
jgi:hypothetical protein